MPSFRCKFHVAKGISGRFIFFSITYQRQKSTHPVPYDGTGLKYFFLFFKKNDTIPDVT